MSFRLWFAFLVFSSFVFGADYGSIVGSFHDAAGSPLPRTKITVVQLPRAGQSVETDLRGEFALENLNPGIYLVSGSTVSGSFSAFVRVRVGDTAHVALGPAEKTLFGGASRFPGLPSDGRTYLDVFRERASTTGGQQGGDVEGFGVYATPANLALNSLGQRGQSNNFLLDGMDNNDPWVRGSIFLPPSEAIASANLLNGYIPAEFGRSSGASIVVQTRSGTNNFHGMLFDDFRNSALDTRNFFDGDGKAAATENRFGAALGGPVRKDKWFLFGDAQVVREKEGLTLISTVPTVAEKAGNFGPQIIYDPATITSIGENIFSRQPFTNNRIPMPRVPAPIQKLLSLYPNPNLPGSADNYRLTPSAIRNGEHFDLRSDHVIGARNALFARGTYQSNDSILPGAFSVPAGIAYPAATVGSDFLQQADNTNTHTKSWGGVVSDTFSFAPSLINQFRAGLTAAQTAVNANDASLNAAAFLGVPGLSTAGLPSFDITGFTSLGSAGAAPVHLRTLAVQFDDSISWTTTHHAWKFGAQAIRRQANGNASDITSRGNYIFTPDYTSYPGSPAATGDAFASFLLGFPSEVQRDVQFAPYRLRGWEFAGYAQDRIRWKRLTVQAGLRYSFLPPLSEANDRLVNFNFSRTAPALDQFASANGVNSYASLDFNRRALAPNVGFVFDLTQDGSTVLRGGFSKSFDTGTYLTMGWLARNAPYASQFDRINGTFQLGQNLSAGLPMPMAAPLLNPAALNSANAGAINAIQPEAFTPYADQWNLFVERALRPRLTVALGGLGSMGVHLYAGYDENQPYPAPTPYATTRYPFEPYHSRVNYLNLGGGSTYYAGEAKLTGQLTRDLTVQFSYAYAKSLDDASVPGTATASRPSGPQNIYDARGNRSPSPFDVTHRVVLSALYRSSSMSHRTLLGGWNLSTLITAQTGFPLTPELATNSLNNGGYQLPDRVADGSLPADQRSVLQWFDTKIGGAFREPALYQYGNTGYGVIRGPGLLNVDLALAKSFRLMETLRLEPRIEALNLLNHANFALPNRVLGVESSGAISHTVTPSRQLQLSLALRW